MWMKEFGCTYHTYHNHSPSHSCTIVIGVICDINTCAAHINTRAADINTGTAAFIHQGDRLMHVDYECVCAHHTYHNFITYRIQSN